MEHNEEYQTTRLLAILIVTVLSILSIFLIPTYSKIEPIIQFNEIPDKFEPGKGYNFSITLTNPQDETEEYYYEINKTGYFYNSGSEPEDIQRMEAEINTTEWKGFKFLLNNRPGLYRLEFFPLNYRYNKTLGRGRDMYIKEIIFHPNPTIKAEFLEGGQFHDDWVVISGKRNPASVLALLPENVTLSVVARGKNVDGWPKMAFSLKAVNTKGRAKSRFDISNALIAGLPEEIAESKIVLDKGENISINGHFNADNYDYIKITANIFYDSVGIKTAKSYIVNHDMGILEMIASMILETSGKVPDQLEIAYLESKLESRPIFLGEDIKKEIRAFEQKAAQVPASEMVGGSRYDDDTRVLISNGDISAMLATPGETIVLDIMARGTFVKGWPHIVVKLDGVELGETDIVTEKWKRYRFYGKIVMDDVSFRPQLNLTISFTNDYYDRDSKEDRNLYIKKVLYTKERDRTIMEIKNRPSSVTPDKNYNVSFEIKNPSNETMYYVYEVLKTGHLKGPSGESTAEEILVDSNEWKEFGLTMNNTAGVYRIGIEFINDLYDKERGIDRNLYVKEVVIGPNASVKPKDMEGGAYFGDIITFPGDEEAYFTAVMRENASFKVMAKGKYGDGWPIMRVSINLIEDTDIVGEQPDVELVRYWEVEKIGRGTVVLDGNSTVSIVEGFNVSGMYDYANITVSLVSSSLGWKMSEFSVSNSMYGEGE